MSMSRKIFAASAAAAALAITPVAIGAGGASATATPSHVKEGKKVTIKVTGMKPKEKVKSTELIVQSGQKRVLYPRAGSTGVLIETLKAQVKGRHTVTFVGRTSHRKAKTQFVVK